MQAATEFLQRTGLSSDVQMRHLLDISQIQNNRPKSWNITLQVTTEVHRNLRILASLNLRATKLPISLEGSYDLKEHKRTEYSLTIAVKF